LRREINVSSPPPFPTNLAFNKSATESSTFNGDRYASRAVDGNTDGALYGYASATNYENQPWWQVDLGSKQARASIEVWGRTDC
jgi:alpha-L-fucosidase 2